MPPRPTPNGTVRSFRKLSKDYFLQTFEMFPIAGSVAGLKEFNDKLGRPTSATHERHAKLARETLAAIEAAPMHAFEGDDEIDRRLMLAHLRRGEILDGEMRQWRTNPQVHLDRAADSIHHLLVRNADDLRPVAEAIVARVRAFPRFLDEAIECVERPVPLWAELTAQAAPGVCALLDSIVEPLAAASRHRAERLREWSKSAADAVRAYAARVARRRAGEADGYSLGTERFERLMRERLGMNLNAREAVAAAEGLAARLKAELKIEARRHHPRKSAAEILEEAAELWRPRGKDLLDAYRRTTDRVRARFERAGAMTFPEGDRLLVKPVPDFMVHQFPTAAYSSPGPLDKNQTGVFWVNDLSLRRETEAEKRAEIAQHFGMDLTAAHEAYPGHHLQFVTQFKHPSFARKMADHAIYYEGWTLWCEQMSIDLKISNNPFARLIQLHDALWRANRIVIDCGLHTGALTFEGACKRLEREVGFTPGRARVDVNWYTSAPTVPMSYLLGKMELMRLKRLRVDRGGWSLKRFNDWVLSFGAVPWSWIEASGI